MEGTRNWRDVEVTTINSYNKIAPKPIIRGVKQIRLGYFLVQVIYKWVNRSLTRTSAI